MKENELPGMKHEVINITLREPWYNNIPSWGDELDDLRRRYSEEELLKMWDSVMPKLEDEFKRNFDHMLVFGTETYKYDELPILDPSEDGPLKDMIEESRKTRQEAIEKQYGKNF